MREDAWEDATEKGSPEALLENLMKSGYPWHALGQKLKLIDQNMEIVTNEYAQIHDSMNQMNSELDALSRQQMEAASKLPQTIRSVLHDETQALQNRWLVAAASLLMAMLGLVVTFTSSERALNFLKLNGSWVGLTLIICGIVVVVLLSRRNKGP